MICNARIIYVNVVRFQNNYFDTYYVGTFEVFALVRLIIHLLTANFRGCKFIIITIRVAENNEYLYHHYTFLKPRRW